MAQMKLDIRVLERDVDAAIRALELSTSPPALKLFMETRVKQWLQTRSRDRFALEGDDASGEWEDLADVTYNIRERDGFVPIAINDRTGALKAWVTTAPGESVATPSLTWMEWPGPAPTPDLDTKRKTAQRGKNDPATPARPVIAANEADLLAVLTLLGNFVLTGEMIRAFR